MNNMPRITVLMPVWNGEKYLRAAIESILNQTFKDFELLIIDDGSTDNSAETIRSYVDPRIIFIQNEANMGLVKTLNKGLDLAKGKYIARMDCDDISLPQRFEKQFDFLESNPDVGVCGTWLQTFGAESDVWRALPDHECIKAELLFQSSIWHATIMGRKDVFDKFNLRYDSDFVWCEDYELWTRMLQHTKAENLQEVLYHYLKHPSQICVEGNNIQIENVSRIRKAEISKFGIEISRKQEKAHEMAGTLNFEITKKNVNNIEKWLIELIEINKSRALYDDAALKKIVFNRWERVCVYSSSLGIWAWFKFIKSPLYSNASEKLSLKKSLVFFVRCLLKFKKPKNNNILFKMVYGSYRFLRRKFDI